MWVSMVGVDTTIDQLDDLLIGFDTLLGFKSNTIANSFTHDIIGWELFVYFVLFSIILFYSFYTIFFIKTFLCYFSPSIYICLHLYYVFFSFFFSFIF